MRGIARLCATIMFPGLLLACSDQKSAAEHVASAANLLEEQNYRAATIELKNTLQQEPNNIRARQLLGTVYFRLGDYVSAKKELEAAANLGGSSNVILPMLAQTQLELGELEEVADLDVTNLTPPASAEVLAAQGLAKLKRGDKAGASAFIARALEQAPESAYVLLTTAMVDASAPRSDMKRARESLLKILSIDAKYAVAWTLLGDIERYESHPSEAEAAYSKAIALGEKHRYARLRRAYIRTQHNDLDGAQSDLDVLAKAFPRNVEVNYLQGLILLKQGNLIGAEDSFDAALQVGDDYPPALFGKATTQYLQGEDERAMASAQQFVTLNPENSRGRVLLATLQLLSKDYAAVEETLRPVIDFDPDVGLQTREMFALALLRQGKSGESTSLLEQISLEQPDSSRTQIELAIAYLQSGDDSAALKILDTVRGSAPDSLTADTLMVAYHLDEGSLDKALDAAETLRDRSPENPEAYNTLAKVYLASGEKQKARAQYQQALEISPGNPTAALSLGILALAERDTNQTRDYFTQVLEHHPDHLQALLLLAALEDIEKKPTEAKAVLERAATSHPKSKAAKVALANYHLRQNEPLSVFQLFPELAPAKEDSAAVLKVVGQAYLQTRNFTSAQDTLQYLVKLKPDSWQAHYLLANAYAGLNKRVEMRLQLESAVELAPESLPVRLALARLLLLEGETVGFEAQMAALESQWPEQIDVLNLATAQATRSGDLNKALQKAELAFEQSPSGQNLILLIRLKVRTDDIAGARAIQKDWISKNPESVTGYHMLAAIYAVEGHLDDAILAYQAALKLDPNNFITLNNLSWYLQSSNPEAALEYAQKAHKLYPASIDAMDTLAMVMLEANQKDEAKQLINRALEKRPDNPALRYHSAVIDVALGNHERALQTLASLRQEGRDFAEQEEANQLLSQLQSSAPGEGG